MPTKLGMGLQGAIPEEWDEMLRRRLRPACIKIHGGVLALMPRLGRDLLDAFGGNAPPIIIREWMSDGFADRLSPRGTPEQAAEDWFDSLRNMGVLDVAKQYPNTYVFHANEPDVSTPEQRHRLAAFERHRLKLLESEGLKGAIYGFSVGNPDVKPTWYPAHEKGAHWDDLIDTLIYAITHGHIWTPHEYHVVTPGYGGATSNWHWQKGRDDPLQVHYDGGQAAGGWFWGRSRWVYERRVYPELLRRGICRTQAEAVELCRDTLYFGEMGPDAGVGNAHAKQEWGLVRPGGGKQCADAWHQHGVISHPTLEAAAEYAVEQFKVIDEMMRSWPWCGGGAIFLVTAYPDWAPLFQVGRPHGYGIWERLLDYIEVLQQQEPAPAPAPEPAPVVSGKVKMSLFVNPGTRDMVLRWLEHERPNLDVALIRKIRRES